MGDSNSSGDSKSAAVLDSRSAGDTALVAVVGLVAVGSVSVFPVLGDSSPVAAAVDCSSRPQLSPLPLWRFGRSNCKGKLSFKSAVITY